MKDLSKKFKGFELINDEELNYIKGGDKWCNWAADMHTCYSAEVTCKSGFVVTTCAIAETVECGSGFTSTHV